MGLRAHGVWLTPLHAGCSLKDSSVLSIWRTEQTTKTVCSHQKKFQSYYSVLVTVLSALQNHLILHLQQPVKGSTSTSLVRAGDRWSPLVYAGDQGASEAQRGQVTSLKPHISELWAQGWSLHIAHTWLNDTLYKLLFYSDFRATSKLKTQSLHPQSYWSISYGFYHFSLITSIPSSHTTSITSWPLDINDTKHQGNFPTRAEQGFPLSISRERVEPL